MEQINEIIASVRKSLLEHKELNKENIERFNKIIPGSKNPLVVKTPVIATIATNIWKDMKKDRKHELLQLCDQLWFNNKYYEEYKVIILLLEKFVKIDPTVIIQRINSYIPSLHTWDLVDQFGMRLCAELVKQDISHLKIFVPLMKSDNFWIRRLTLVSLVRLRQETLTDEQWLKIQTILDHHWKDSEYYVQKALSWSLRELSRVNGDLIFTYLRGKLNKLNKNSEAPITLRFLKDCIKHLPEQQRKEIVLRYQRALEN